jgi:hypothetical protein
MVNAVLVERNINAINKKAAAASRLDVVIIVDPLDEIYLGCFYLLDPPVRTYI